MIKLLRIIHNKSRVLFGITFLPIVILAIYGPLKVSDIVLEYLEIDVDNHIHIYYDIRAIWALFAVIGLLFILKKVQLGE